jgi:hypothetical protein
VLWRSAGWDFAQGGFARTLRTPLRRDHSASAPEGRNHNEQMQETERRSCRGKLGVCKAGRGDSKARRSVRRRGAATGQITDERSGDARRWAEITR